jgi:hypothetical protein
MEIGLLIAVTTIDENESLKMRGIAVYQEMDRIGLLEAVLKESGSSQNARNCHVNLQGIGNFFSARGYPGHFSDIFEVLS